VILLSAGSLAAALMFAHRARGCRAVCPLVAGISPGAVTRLERAGIEAGTAASRRTAPQLLSPSGGLRQLGPDAGRVGYLVDEASSSEPPGTLVRPAGAVD
jgi:hypothetical protein